MSDDVTSVPSIADVRARLLYDPHGRDDPGCDCTGCVTVRLLDAVEPLLEAYGNVLIDEQRAPSKQLIRALLRPARGEVGGGDDGD